jgi:hypothetical protein
VYSTETEPPPTRLIVTGTGEFGLAQPKKRKKAHAVGSVGPALPGKQAEIFDVSPCAGMLVVRTERLLVGAEYTVVVIVVGVALPSSVHVMTVPAGVATGNWALSRVAND